MLPFETDQVRSNSWKLKIRINEEIIEAREPKMIGNNKKLISMLQSREAFDITIAYYFSHDESYLSFFVPHLYHYLMCLHSWE